MCCFSFGSPVSASTGSKQVFDIKSTEDKTNISKPLLSVSGKNAQSFVSMSASASPKIRGDGFGE